MIHKTRQFRWNCYRSNGSNRLRESLDIRFYSFSFTSFSTSPFSRLRPLPWLNNTNEERKRILYAHRNVIDEFFFYESNGDCKKTFHPLFLFQIRSTRKCFLVVDKDGKSIIFLSLTIAIYHYASQYFGFSLCLSFSSDSP